VDSLIEMEGKVWRFVDTAGLRRKVGQASGHEFYASVRTHGAIDAAEVVIVLNRRIGAVEEQDLRVLSMVIEAGRALVLAFNKWDLVDEDGVTSWTTRSTAKLAQVQVGATGQHPPRRPDARCRSWCRRWRVRWHRGMPVSVPVG